MITVPANRLVRDVKVAAASVDRFVKLAVAASGRIECQPGSPGRPGPSPIQYVGMYGEVSETVARVEALDRTTRHVVWLTNEECRFGYRTSVFKNIERERYVVLSVTFRLRGRGQATVKEPELQK